MGRSDVTVRSLPRMRARLAIAVLALACWGQIVQAQTPSRQSRAWDPRWFIGVSVVVLLQGALIAALLVQRTRRVRAERGLLESEERFRHLADTAPVPVWRAGPDKLCDFFNRPWVEFTGRTIEQELGNGWSEGVSPEDLDRCLRTYESAFDARQPFQMEYRLRRADGVYRWVLDNGVPTYHSDGRFSGYIGSCVDITDQKDSANRLRDSQERYAMASVAGAVGIWDWNFETNELYVDPTLKSLLGFEDAEVTTRPDDWGSRVHPEDLPLAAARIQACIDGTSDVYEVEHRMLHKDGSSRWFLSRGSAIRGADGAVRRIVGTKVEITERKRAEEEIRNSEAVLQESHREIRHLAGSLITAQDAERARIGRDLHDDVNQQLAALSIALSGVKRRLGTMPDGKDLQASLCSMQGRVAALVESVRSLSHDLHPDVLKHGGLTAALSAHCAGIARTQKIAVTCTAEGDFESVHPKVAFCLYRIAQEALRNVVKHSNASQAEVRLLRADDNLELTVADNGQGFDVIEARKSGRGLGLLSMSERVRLARGTLSLVAELRKGTQVRVRLPVDWREAEVGDVPGQYQVI